MSKAAQPARLFVAIAFTSLSACATPQSSFEGNEVHDAVTVVEVFGFESCPNTPEMISRVRSANAPLSDLRIEYVDLESLPENDPRRGWPAPSVVINGEDLFGLPRPRSTGLQCRHYADGLPSISEIRIQLKEATLK